MKRVDIGRKVEQRRNAASHSEGCQPALNPARRWATGPPRKRRNPRNLLLSTYCANGGLFASGWSGGRPARRIATSRATTNKLVTKPATPAHPCRAQNHPPAVPSTLDPR